MSKIEIKDSLNILPLGYVKIIVKDKKTGRVLDKHQIPFNEETNKNTTTNGARKALCHLYGAEIAYVPARIEWGIGSTEAKQSDEDLAIPFSPTRIFTPVTSKSYPTADGRVIKFISELDGVVIPSGYVREIALRTNPIANALDNYPHGILTNRFVFKADYPYNPSLTITIEWLCIFS